MQRNFGPRGRIGAVIPANNATLEAELWPRLPAGVALYATRILARGDLTPAAVHAMEHHFDRAVEELVATGVDLLVYADMVTTFVMEPGWNAARTEAVRARTGLPCTTAGLALEAALEALSVRRFALGTPYPQAVHALAPAWFAAAGYTVTAEATLDIVAMSEVPEVAPERLAAFAAGLSTEGAEALVLLATDLPTLAQLEALEQAAGVPVVTSNQAILWHALRLCGVQDRLPGLGRLLAEA